MRLFFDCVTAIACILKGEIKMLFIAGLMIGVFFGMLISALLRANKKG